jgi:hypothetical protein
MNLEIEIKVEKVIPQIPITTLPGYHLRNKRIEIRKPIKISKLLKAISIKPGNPSFEQPSIEAGYSSSKSEKSS